MGFIEQFSNPQPNAPVATKPAPVTPTQPKGFVDTFSQGPVEKAPLSETGSTFTERASAGFIESFTGSGASDLEASLTEKNPLKAGGQFAKGLAKAGLDMATFIPKGIYETTKGFLEEGVGTVKDIIQGRGEQPTPAYSDITKSIDTALLDKGPSGGIPGAFLTGLSETMPFLGVGEEAVKLPDKFSLPKSMEEVKSTFSPQTASPEAQLTADKIRASKAKIKNTADVEALKYKNVEKAFAKNTPEQNISNISDYERTGKFSTEPSPGYSEFYRKSTDQAHQILDEVYKNDVPGYVDNYVRRAFKFGSLADEEKARSILTNKINSLSADKSVVRGRTLKVPLDEALKDMQDRGIKVQMASDNPEVLRQWTVKNAQQALAFKGFWDQAKTQGLVRFVNTGAKIPEGLVPLEDRVATVFAHGDQGLTKVGQYYADPNVARVLDNSISQGLASSPTYRGLRSLENSMNQLQLGISGFHLTGTAINASVSDAALGLRQLARGFKNLDPSQIGAGTLKIGRAMTGVGSFINDTYKGSKFLQDLKNDNPEAYKFMEEKLNPAGGRLGLDTRYLNDSYKNMVNAWRNGEYGSSIKKIPGAILEKVSAPIMQYAVPRIKLGAFMDLANDVTSRLPTDATPEVRARALASAWDSIDNRFGQLTYDNLFWNKTVQDLSMLGTRSLGWNLGTVRELGGGVSDILKGNISDRAIYVFALPVYVGMLGAIYQYLHTGQGPTELKDYLYPKNGLKDKNGNDDRITLPTYMKDVAGYATDPLGTVGHKTSPFLDMAIALMSNKDYYGDLIRNPQDPVGLQLQQAAGYIAQDLQPFSLQQAERVAKEKGGEQAAESFMGIIPAPRAVVKSPEQTQLQENYQKIYGAFAPRTPEQVQADTFKTQASDLIKQGKLLEARSILDQIRKLGGFKSKIDEQIWIKSQRKSTEAKLKGTEKILKFQGRQ